MTRFAGVLRAFTGRSIIVAALATGAQPASSQVRPAIGDTAAALSRGDSLPAVSVLAVTSEPSGARVYRDTVFLGTTPIAIPANSGDSSAAGRVLRLTILGGDPGNWSVPVVTDSVILPALAGPPAGSADTIRRHYVLPLAARIASDPPDADVFLGDSLLGRTPLFVSVPGPVATLSLRKDGYGTRAVFAGRDAAEYSVKLEREGGPGGAEPSPLAEVSGKGRAPLFIAAGTAVAAGAAAAWLKNRADNYYEDYQRAGGQATLDRVRRYDLLSGIALSVAEIGLGYLIIELLSR